MIKTPPSVLRRPPRPTPTRRIALDEYYQNDDASVSGMILTTECALVDIKEETPAPPPMGGGGMPGMM